MKVQHPFYGQVTLSEEQAAIVDAIGTALQSSQAQPVRQRLMVKAYAGSGKTTTLCIAAYVHRQLFGSGIYAAFSKELGNEVNPKLDATPMNAINFHKLGYAAFAQIAPKRRKKNGSDGSSIIRVEDWKYRNIIRTYADTAFKYETFGRKLELQDTIREIVDKIRLNLVDPRELDAVEKCCIHYGISTDERAMRAVAKVLKTGMDMAMGEGVIDFTDMIYVPYMRRDQIQWKPVDMLFLDECQDMSALTLEFMLQYTGRGTVIVGCGDPHQSIMGFAGAMANSFDLVAQRIKVTTSEYLPMSYSRRCAKRVIAIAQQDVPDIKALPDAPEGEVLFVPELQVLALAKPGDYILSRTTRPLVELWLQFMQDGVNARVRGKDKAVEALNKHLEKIEQLPGFRFEYFLSFVHQYHDDTLAKLRQNNASPFKSIVFNDEMEIIEALANCPRFVSIQDVRNAIREMFSEGSNCVILMTAHRSKGLEAKTVYILHPENFPFFRPDQQAWQIEQEYNLRYVAYTRARYTLVFLTNKDFDYDGRDEEAARTDEAPIAALPDPMVVEGTFTPVEDGDVFPGEPAWEASEPTPLPPWKDAPQPEIQPEPEPVEEAQPAGPVQLSLFQMISNMSPQEKAALKALLD